MRILVLYSRMADYFYQGLRLAVAEFGADILVVCQQPVSTAPFQFEALPQLQFVHREELDKTALHQLMQHFKPERIYLAGWNDTGYRSLALKAKKLKIPVILGMDNYWKGGWKQRLGTLLLPYLLPRIADRCWVPGPPQFAYALRLGFKGDQIRTGLYAALREPFEQAAASRSQPMPTVLLFVGRLVAYKNPLQLAVHFLQARQRTQSNWQLWIAGDGPEMEAIQALGNQDAIRLLGFTQPKDLPGLFAQAGAFCLPSHQEHWGVVVHEAACAGLPILSTHSTGASSVFLYQGFNGWKFDSQKPKELQQALVELMETNAEKRRQFGQRSAVLSRAYSLEQFVAVLTEPMNN